MTHHLNHDEATWIFLGTLFAYLRGCDAIAWMSPPRLFGLPGLAAD
jgi:hypothetical protein